MKEVIYIFTKCGRCGKLIVKKVYDFSSEELRAMARVFKRVESKCQREIGVVWKVV
jgi:hypothetical protein